MIEQNTNKIKDIVRRIFLSAKYIVTYQEIDRMIDSINSESPVVEKYTWLETMVEGRLLTIEDEIQLFVDEVEEIMMKALGEESYTTNVKLEIVHERLRVKMADMGKKIVEEVEILIELTRTREKDKDAKKKKAKVGRPKDKEKIDK